MEIGTIKENPSEVFTSIAGVNLLIMKSLSRDDEHLIITPMTEMGFEKYYKYSFSEMGRKNISSDYKYFLEYMLDGNCELISTIKTEELEDIRSVTEKDLIEWDRVMKWFVDKYKLEIRNQEG